MKLIKRAILFMMVLVMVGLVPVGANLGGIPEVSAASKASKVVQNARSNYNTIQKNLKKYTKVKSNDACTDYYDQNGRLRLTIVKANKDDVLSLKNITCEYYYNTQHKLVFAFAYKKTNGKVKEYRAYYSASNYKCYRYIGPDKKVHTYSSGKSDGKMPQMARTLKNKGYYNLHLLGY